MLLFEDIYNINELEKTISLCNSIIEDLSKPQKLGERIIIDGVNAKIQIDKNLLSVFKDIKQTTQLTKNLYKQIENKNVLTSSYEKFFRLISKNMKALIEFLQKCFNDSRIIEKIPKKIVDKGKTTADSFVDNMNNVFETVNTKTNGFCYDFPKLEKPKWKSGEDTEMWRKQTLDDFKYKGLLDKTEYFKRKSEGYPLLDL